MTTIPFWIDSAPIKRFPTLRRNINVDVLVIGAGITGITTAYLLAKEGLTVGLIERERVASIDTGHTTAHLTYVTDVALHELAGNFGNDHKLGFGATYLERVPYFSVPGVRFPNQAKFHPRKYLRALVMKLSRNDSRVFEKSAVTEFDAGKTPRKNQWSLDRF